MSSAVLLGSGGGLSSKLLDPLLLCLLFGALNPPKHFLHLLFGVLLPFRNLPAILGPHLFPTSLAGFQVLLKFLSLLGLAIYSLQPDVCEFLGSMIEQGLSGFWGKTIP